MASGIVRQPVREEFARLGYDPYDVKAVLHPVDLVVFDGMNAGNLKNIILLSGRTENIRLQEIRKKMEKTVADGSYDWKVLRFLRDGAVKYEQ